MFQINCLTKSSKLGSLSLIASEDSRKSSQQTVEAGLDWVLKVEDKDEEILFKNGNRYVGRTSSSLMDGKGTFYWADGSTYKGRFKDGYPHGAGRAILPDLSIYEGDFFRGYFHGHGVFRIAKTPAIYSGSWKHGKRHGKGWLLWEARNWYDGEWADNDKHGFGYRRYKDGNRYKGLWANDKRNGEGSMIWQNNDYYVGEWMDNKPHGYGEYTWNLFFNKSFIFPYYNWYKGSWADGLRTGAGVMDFGANSGAKLAGVWVNNSKHGPGVMVCGNGYTLQRNPLFENDKPVHMNSKQEEENICNASVSNSARSAAPSTRTYVESEDKVLTDKHSFKQMLKEINSKVALKTFDSDILTHITKSGLNISVSKFVKLTDQEISKTEIEKWSPLEVPIHIVAEEVDLNYYINMIINYFFENSQMDLLRKKFEYIKYSWTKGNLFGKVDDGRKTSEFTPGFQQ